MPRFVNDNEMTTYQIGGGFNFNGARISDLGAAEYTLVTIAVDLTGSIEGFEDQLRQMVVSIMESFQGGPGRKPHPRADNLLVRLITFSDRIGVQEIHGFISLSDINPQDYPSFSTGGLTNLYDATFSAVAATVKYGEGLYDKDFAVNGIVFIITDGYDNASTMTAESIAQQCKVARTGEKVESLMTILIGVNASSYQNQLDAFRKAAALDQYTDAGDATPDSLARLGGFVSQSISSQSLALGSGGPSQAIPATI
jgi:hypothetical protein